MKRLILGLAFLLLVLRPGSVGAIGGERITSFLSAAVMAADGTLDVTETIVVNFGTNDHHGIFRDIPVILHSGADSYYYRFALIGVSSSTGAPAAIASNSQSGDTQEIKIGDANSTVSGSQSYTIHYTLAPFALRNGEVDRINLNVTGQSWEYPIDQASLKLTLPVAPKGAPICYTGIADSQDHNCSVITTGSIVDVTSTGVIKPGQGLTVDMYLTQNSFTSYLAPNVRPPMTLGMKLLLGFMGLLWLIGLVVLAAYARAALANRRLRRSQIVVAQYESPDGLTPGQIGLLVDSKTDMKEFTATIIDLAVRGYLKITRTESKRLGLFTSVEYQFDRLKELTEVRDYEHTVFDLLFSQGASIKLSEIANKGRATENKAALDQLKDQLGKSLRGAGYYNPKANFSNGAAALLPLFGFGLAGVVPLFGNPIPGIIALVLFAIAYYLLRYYPRLTAEGASEWAKVEGFKLYLGVAEKDRLNFTDAPERTPELFNKLLPYAVALGVEKQWAKQFEGIDISAGSGWYSGNGAGFNSALFASSFASSLSSSVNSSFAGASGAGGAGGGGGGGGGGGW